MDSLSLSEWDTSDEDDGLDNVSYDEDDGLPELDDGGTSSDDLSRSCTPTEVLGT